MKQYNLGGLGSNVELGKQGPEIVGSDSAQITFNDAQGNTTVVAVADGTGASHAVTKSQLDTSLAQKISKTTTTVNYNDGTVFLGTASANCYIHKVVVEADATWTGADSNTNITVGDSSDVDRLFSEFDPDVQSIDESDHKYTSDTTVNIYVTQGNASAGNAKVTVWHTGTISTTVNSITVDYLIVAGGGGAGNGYDTGAGGGGAGGMVLQSNTSVSVGTTYSITVGSGGAGGANARANNNGTAGEDSSAFGITALGGSAGNGSRTVSRSHGDGGDAASDPSTAAQGGDGGGNANSASGGSGGGGGGATGAGSNGSGGSGGAGGAGEASSISGSNVTYGAGGAGARGNTTSSGASGSANTGNGGAGGVGASFASGAGGNGGSGVVIIRYPDSNSAATTTGSVTSTTSGGYRIYTFTGDGTITL